MLAYLASWIFPFDDVLAQAQDMANNLWPVFVVPLGLIIGIGVLNYVIRAVKSGISSFT